MVLERFGFSPSFLSWIKILYSSPVASFRNNKVTSSYFPLHRGARQGCCLSPFLFDMAIEPLAIALWAEERFKGILRGNITHKVSLHADDRLLYISCGVYALSFRHATRIWDISGSKLSLIKSVLLPFNQLAEGIGYANFPFKVAHQAFNYLGIKVTCSFKALFKHNFKTLVERTKQDFTMWSSLPISLAGNIEFC